MAEPSFALGVALGGAIPQSVTLAASGALTRLPSGTVKAALAEAEELQKGQILDYVMANVNSKVEIRFSGEQVSDAMRKLIMGEFQQQEMPFQQEPPTQQELARARSTLSEWQARLRGQSTSNS